MKKIIALFLTALMIVFMVSCNKSEEENKDDSVVEAEQIVKIYTDAKTGDKFTYDVNEEGEYEITGFTSATETPHAIEVPKSIDNITVTGVGAEAFKAKNQISEIVIPETVKYIGQFAFYGCIYLNKVTMTDNVERLGEGAFKGCIALKDINLSKNIKDIADFAFADCVALESITLSDSATEISDGAFFGCSALKSIELPSTLKTIGKGAFWGNSALDEITIPASVESIGGYTGAAKDDASLDEYAFSVNNNDDFVIVGVAESVAHKYAVKYGHEFVTATAN